MGRESRRRERERLTRRERERRERDRLLPGPWCLACDGGTACPRSGICAACSERLDAALRAAGVRERFVEDLGRFYGASDGLVRRLNALAVREPDLGPPLLPAVADLLEFVRALLDRALPPREGR